MEIVTQILDYYGFGWDPSAPALVKVCFTWRERERARKRRETRETREREREREGTKGDNIINLPQL